jgi:hypothetical protein
MSVLISIELAVDWNHHRKFLEFESPTRGHSFQNSYPQF